MGGGGSSPVTYNTNVISFSPYLEAAHKQMLNRTGADVLTKSVFQAMNAAFGQSPYDEYVTIEADDGFLGVGKTIGQRTAAFDMFATYVSGVDLDALWEHIYDHVDTSSVMQKAISQASEQLQDEIDTRIMPKFLAGMRDANAVMSSAFIQGKALIAESHTKAVNETISKLALQTIEITQDRWAKTLAWNTGVVQTYDDLIKLYYSAKMDTEAREMEFKVKDELWDLSLFEYGRAMVGALNGAPAAQPKEEPSQAAKSISMAAAGAGAGATIGSMISKDGGAAWGAAAGGVVGLAASFV